MHLPKIKGNLYVQLTLTKKFNIVITTTHINIHENNFCVIITTATSYYIFTVVIASGITCRPSTWIENSWWSIIICVPRVDNHEIVDSNKKNDYCMTSEIQMLKITNNSNINIQFSVQFRAEIDMTSNMLYHNAQENHLLCTVVLNWGPCNLPWNPQAKNSESRKK